jgi:hypothetical protein
MKWSWVDEWWWMLPRPCPCPISWLVLTCLGFPQAGIYTHPSSLGFGEEFSPFLMVFSFLGFLCIACPVLSLSQGIDLIYVN